MRHGFLCKNNFWIMLGLLKDYLKGLHQENRRILGDVVTLCVLFKLHKRYQLYLVLRLVALSLESRQFLYYEDDKGPIALCNWAFLDDKLLNSFVEKEYRLPPSKFIAPFGHCCSVVKDQKAQGLHVTLHNNKIEFRGSIYHSQTFS